MLHLISSFWYIKNLGLSLLVFVLEFVCLLMTWKLILNLSWSLFFSKRKVWSLTKNRSWSFYDHRVIRIQILDALNMKSSFTLKEEILWIFWLRGDFLPYMNYEDFLYGEDFHISKGNYVDFLIGELLYQRKEFWGLIFNSDLVRWRPNLEYGSSLMLEYQIWTGNILTNSIFLGLCGP